jgi:hypothetical protein
MKNRSSFDILRVGALVLLASAVVGPAGVARAASFSYSDFSSTTGLTLNGDAAQAGNVLRLVPSTDTQAGTAFYDTPMSLNAGTSFSTAFSFNVTTGLGGGGAPDGFSFILQNIGVTALGDGGQGLGYTGLSPSVAVLFRGRDPSFIGVIAGGIDPANLPTPFSPPGAATGLTEGAFYGQDEYAWIDYSGGMLDVYLSSTNVKPGTATATATMGLAAILGSDAYVGFGAGNGGGYGTQDILNWNFNETQSVPEPPAGLILVAAGLALGFCRRMRAGAR